MSFLFSGNSLSDNREFCFRFQVLLLYATHRLKEEPYEAEVNAMGYSFHILFGHHRDGWFLCIPNWNFGCELAHPSDLFWNMDSMTRETSKLDYEDATAIAYALNTLSSYLEK